MSHVEHVAEQQQESNLEVCRAYKIKFYVIAKFATRIKSSFMSLRSSQRI